MRSDILRLYKDVHTWTGIISGLFLFIAFYAGAISMFEAPLQRWATAPSKIGELTALEKTPELIEAVQQRYPQTQAEYNIVIEASTAHPTRLFWDIRQEGEDDHHQPVRQNATFDKQGNLSVTESRASAVAQFVDTLHQQAGLPFDHEIAMPMMGIVSLLYALALISGVIVLIPTLVKDLFALRLGKNLKRMWLDFHNILGLFSLPFHVIIALTSVVFAFHDQFYSIQHTLAFQGDRAFVTPDRRQLPDSATKSKRKMLTPVQLIDRLAEQAPDFKPHYINYRAAPQAGPGLIIFGSNPEYGMRSPQGGVVGLDPYTGNIVATDYMPGMQNNWGAVITSFFTLHFGSYGGYPIRWTYFLLGLTGAMLFYSGNLLWLESRRKKLKKSSKVLSVKQSRSCRIMGALTIGVTSGCVAGISLTIAAAKIMPALSDHPDTLHQWIYYSVFFSMIGWAFYRGVARAAVELLYCAALATLMIPGVSVASLIIPAFGWNYSDASILIDMVSVVGALGLWVMANKTAARIQQAPTDSIWCTEDSLDFMAQKFRQLLKNTDQYS